MSENLTKSLGTNLLATSRKNVGFFSEIYHSKMHVFANGDWFNVPKGWVTDSPGIIALHSATHGPVDMTLIVDGLEVAATHNENFRGGALQMLCPKGVSVSYVATNYTVGHFRFKRIQY